MCEGQHLGITHAHDARGRGNCSRRHTEKRREYTVLRTHILIRSVPNHFALAQAAYQLSNITANDTFVGHGFPCLQYFISEQRVGIAAIHNVEWHARRQAMGGWINGGEMSTQQQHTLAAGNSCFQMFVTDESMRSEEQRLNSSHVKI